MQESLEAITKVFENVSYIRELRQRWLEIKKLLKGGLPDQHKAYWKQSDCGLVSVLPSAFRNRLEYNCLLS